ncbi:monocarboxylate transporter 12-like [Lytechinus pictus]|uniref:monocarboxylate transporter 12-like n=1 Tax=Lytechinus pictus TaxID=7653 RepID=UPI0030B9E57D
MAIDQITSLDAGIRKAADSALSPSSLQTHPQDEKQLQTGSIVPDGGPPTSKPGEKTTNEDSTTSRHLDQGWAWVVMAAAMMTHILTFGLTYAMVGIFHVELLEEFERGDSDTAWTGSILLGTMLCSGPITSVLVGRFGAQVIAIIGGLLSSAGLCLSAAASSLDSLFFTYGALTGFGFGLCYLPCIVMVGRFFEKRRSIATGFVVAGSGMGTFMFAPIVQIIVEEVGWRHAFLILGALELILCLCGATYIPKLIPERPSPEDYQKHLRDLERQELEMSLMEGDHTELDSIFSLSSYLPVGSVSQGVSRNVSKNVSVTSLSGPSKPSAGSSGENKEADTLNILRAGTVTPLGIAEDARTLSSIIPYTAAMDIYSNRIPSASTIVVPESIHSDSRCGRCLSPFYKVLRLLDNRFLVVFAISNFILCIGYQLPYVYFKAYAIRIGVGEDEWSFILSVMGIMDTLGRILVGFVFDRIIGKHRRMLGYVSSCTLAGTLLLLVPLASGYLSLAVLASLFALIAGSTDSLTPALLVAFVGLDTLGYSFGFVIEMQGLGFLVGPPTAGALYGLFMDYAVVFYAGGSAFVLAGIIMVLEPVLGGQFRCRSGT